MKCILQLQAPGFITYCLLKLDMGGILLFCNSIILKKTKKQIDDTSD